MMRKVWHQVHAISGHHVGRCFYRCTRGASPFLRLVVVLTLIASVAAVLLNDPTSWEFTHPITGVIREKVRIGQQPAGDRNPGAGIVTVESGDDNNGNGFRKCEFTHRSNVGTIRCSGPNGDGMEFEFGDGNPNTPAWLSVKDGDGAMGAFIQARNRNDSLGVGVSFEDPAHPYFGTIETHTSLVPVEALHIRNTQPDSDIVFTFQDSATGLLVERLYQHNDGSLVLASGAAGINPSKTREDAVLTLLADGPDAYIEIVSENPNQEVRICFSVEQGGFCRGQIIFDHGSFEFQVIVGSFPVLVLDQSAATFLRPVQMPLYTQDTRPDCTSLLRGAVILFEPSGGPDETQACMRDGSAVFSWRGEVFRWRETS